MTAADCKSVLLRNITWFDSRTIHQHYYEPIVTKLYFPRALQADSYVAVSGGVDSVSLLHTLIRMGKNPKIAHFVHDDPYSETELDFVYNLADRLKLKLTIGSQTAPRPAGASKEGFWREERYRFFHSLPGVIYVGTNLDDAVEWYLMTCLRGEGHYMEYRNQNVEKPLITTAKSDIYMYARHHDLDWIEDPANVPDGPSSGFRALVRQKLAPVAHDVDPGLRGMVRRRLLQKISQSR